MPNAQAVTDNRGLRLWSGIPLHELTVGPYIRNSESPKDISDLFKGAPIGALLSDNTMHLLASHVMEAEGVLATKAVMWAKSSGVCTIRCNHWDYIRQANRIYRKRIGRRENEI